MPGLKSGMVKQNSDRKDWYKTMGMDFMQQ